MHPEPTPENLEKHRRTFLAGARDNFPGFYRMALPLDALLMDRLVVAHAALVLSLHSLHVGFSGPERAERERRTDKIEHVFTVLREAVRRTSTFSSLTFTEKTQIERELFDVRSELEPD